MSAIGDAKRLGMLDQEHAHSSPTHTSHKSPKPKPSKVCRNACFKGVVDHFVNFVRCESQHYLVSYKTLIDMQMPKSKPRVDSGSGSTGSSDDEGDQYCCICAEDADLVCKKCFNDLYCKRCFMEAHKEDPTISHHHGTMLKRKL